MKETQKVTESGKFLSTPFLSTNNYQKIILTNGGIEMGDAEIRGCQFCYLLSEENEYERYTSGERTTNKDIIAFSHS